MHAVERIALSLKGFDCRACGLPSSCCKVTMRLCQHIINDAIRPGRSVSRQPRTSIACVEFKFVAWQGVRVDGRRCGEVALIASCLPSVNTQVLLLCGTCEHAETNGEHEVPVLFLWTCRAVGWSAFCSLFHLEKPVVLQGTYFRLAYSTRCSDRRVHRTQPCISAISTTRSASHKM